MQTETIFRAARALAVVTGAIESTMHDRVQFSFRPGGLGDQLYVVMTGLPVGEGYEEPSTLLNASVKITQYAAGLPSDDRFSLEFVAGNVFRVEAA